jgi:glucosamine 6-phosphate synthetase-like amidotransferase/phosphosugar isomerase protein
MCGIYGILFLKNKNIKADAVKDILSNLMVQSQARGSHATGLSFAKPRRFITYKHNVSAKTFLSLSNMHKVFTSGIGAKPDNFPYSIIGHTRFQTQGSHENPDNNHPIRCGNIIGVHNGSIINDDGIFNWLASVNGKNIRIGQVDSEAIFAGINYVAENNKTAYVSSDAPVVEAIQDMATHLSGSFACALQDVENPKTVWLFRRQQPIELMHFEREGMVIFASVVDYINKAVANLNLEKPRSITMPVNCGICFNLEENIYNRFELNGST